MAAALGTRRYCADGPGADGAKPCGLWAGDFRTALDYAQDGQRYATGVERARLAARCEGRAYARIGNSSGGIAALQRAERAMPSNLPPDDLSPL
jgi:hypothetical protein